MPEIERTVLTSAVITVVSQTATKDKHATFAYNAPKVRLLVVTLVVMLVVTVVVKVVVTRV